MASPILVWRNMWDNKVVKTHIDFFTVKNTFVELINIYDVGPLAVIPLRGTSSRTENDFPPCSL